MAKTSEIRRLARQGEAVYEVHPEVAFATVAGAPLLSKHTSEGRSQRAAVLRQVGIELPPVPKGAKPDDLLDAAICAYVAVGIAAGSSDIRQLPATGNPQPDPATPTPVVASPAPPQQRLVHQS